MSGRRYVDEGSMRVERIDDRFKVRFNISSSVKAVASRVRTHPKSELKSVACVRVNNGKIEHIPITVADFVAFRLPAGTADLLVGLSPNGSNGVETILVQINLPVKYVDILGKRNAVVDLCAWLNVPITAFKGIGL